MVRLVQSMANFDALSNIFTPGLEKNNKQWLIIIGSKNISPKLTQFDTEVGGGVE